MTKQTIITILIGIVVIGGVIWYGYYSQKPNPQKSNTAIIYKEALKESLGNIEKRPYIASERNYDGIRFEELRKQIDPIYNKAHDALSQAYYEGKEFIWNGKNYGILTKEQFNKLQNMLWQRYLVLFHQENQKQGLYKESKYNDVCEEWESTKEGRTCKTWGKRTDKAKEKIRQLKRKGIDIDL